MWLTTGSQNLYGAETLNRVAEHSQQIAAALSDSSLIPVKIVYKPVLTSPQSIRKLRLDVNSRRNGLGFAARKHTFPPAKIRIGG